MKVPTLAVALAAVALAGCLSTSGPVQLPDEGDGPGPLVDALLEGDHNHTDPALHRHQWRMEERSWRPLADRNETAGLHALASWDHYLFADGALNIDGPNGTGGFTILDVEDPSDPKVVGTWSHPDYNGADRSIDVTSDGNWVFLASEAATEETSSAGIFAVDVSDKTDPTTVDFFPLPGGGAHTVEAGMIDGVPYAFGLSWGVNVLRLADGPEGTRLVQEGKYVLPGAEEIAAGSGAGTSERTTEIVRTVYGHDMDFVPARDGGPPLLYVAYAYQGLHVVDVSTPSAPQRLSKWVPGGSGAPFYVHGAESAWIDGRRITVVGSEVFENRHEDTPAPIWVLDTTDPEAPEQLGTWTNPMDVGAQGLLFSTHFTRIMDGVVYMSHYHGGVWAVDISTPDARANPQAVGYYMPANDNGFRPPSGCCGNWNLEGIPMTFDVEVTDGTVWAADWFTGLYGLEPAGA